MFRQHGSDATRAICPGWLPAGSYYVVVDGSDVADAGPYLLDVQTSECGDGTLLKPVEQCDDTNTADGDGCSATCTCEPLAEVEPNDGLATATSSNGFCLASGAVGVAGGMDWYSVDLMMGQTLTVETVAGGANICGPGGNLDSEVGILHTDGTTSLVSNDNVSSSNNWCSEATYRATAMGTYFFRVAASQAFNANGTFDYGVEITID